MKANIILLFIIDFFAISGVVVYLCKRYVEGLPVDTIVAQNVIGVFVILGIISTILS